MNYYDEILKQIEKLINDKDYDEAYRIIKNELNMPYIPSDIEQSLLNYYKIVKSLQNSFNLLTDDDLCGYLKGDAEHQLIACNELHNKNLRDYIDVCDEYLKSNGFINSKALLIDSLIKQEIDYDFSYVNNGSLIVFNPKKMQNIEDTDGFIEANSILDEYYLKDPSKLHLAKELVYKKAILSLPNTINGREVADIVIKYINSAFSAK